MKLIIYSFHAHSLDNKVQVNLLECKDRQNSQS